MAEDNELSIDKNTRINGSEQNVEQRSIFTTVIVFLNIRRCFGCSVFLEHLQRSDSTHSKHLRSFQDGTVLHSGLSVNFSLL